MYVDYFIAFISGEKACESVVGGTQTADGTVGGGGSQAADGAVGGGNVREDAALYRRLVEKLEILYSLYDNCCKGVRLIFCFSTTDSPFVSLCKKAVDELGNKHKEPKTEKLFLPLIPRDKNFQLIENADAYVIYNLNDGDFKKLAEYIAKSGKLLITL